MGLSIPKSPELPSTVSPTALPKLQGISELLRSKFIRAIGAIATIGGLGVIGLRSLPSRMTSEINGMSQEQLERLESKAFHAAEQQLRNSHSPFNTIKVLISYAKILLAFESGWSTDCKAILVRAKYFLETVSDAEREALAADIQALEHILQSREEDMTGGITQHTKGVLSLTIEEEEEEEEEGKAL